VGPTNIGNFSSYYGLLFNDGFFTGHNGTHDPVFPYTPLGRTHSADQAFGNQIPQRPAIIKTPSSGAAYFDLRSLYVGLLRYDADPGNVIPTPTQVDVSLLGLSQGKPLPGCNYTVFVEIDEPAQFLETPACRHVDKILITDDLNENWFINDLDVILYYNRTM
jgi:hypothetical protein